MEGLPDVPDAEHPIHVQAVVSVELGAAWIGKLWNQCPPAVGPLKWKEAEAFVLHGRGVEADAVRDGIAQQIVVLTDAHESARNIDLTARVDGAPAPIATMLLNRTWHGISGTELGRIGSRFREYLLNDVLDRSGMGHVTRLARHAVRHQWLDDADVPAIDGKLHAAVLNVGSQLKRVAKLAGQATVLIARELDPDAARPSAESLMASGFVSQGLPWRYAQAQLRQMADQHVAYDGDDPAATKEVAALRLLAHHASDEWGDEPDRGSVQVVDDANYLRVQLADVVCGWAWRLIATGGLLEVVRRFRLVIYNGEPLSLDRAGELDRRRGEHRRLLREAERRGWRA